MPEPFPPARRNGRFAPVLAKLEGLAMLTALLGAGHALGQAYTASTAPSRTAAGLRVAGVDVGGRTGAELEAAIATATEAGLDRPLVLRAEDERVSTTARALGARADAEATLAMALAYGNTGDPLADFQARADAVRGRVDLPIGYRFADDVALDRLHALEPRIARPSVPTRLDLPRRRVDPATAGRSLLAYDSLSAVAIGLARGAEEIELVTAEEPLVADDPLRDLAADLDVSTVLGSFDTPYVDDATQRERNHNLELGATRLDGTIIGPGETFSFNTVVGPRNVESGFRYAGGITAGELVDVVGGGICQVSSTIFGAAFFAGLRVVEGRPHSRPSTYVDMGLDSTVAWPDLDLRLENPYDFPVVIHMKVSGGKVHAEILGERRPYQVAFERSLIEVTPFRTVMRDDPTLRTGSEVVSQRGMRGFRVERRRKLYQGGQVVETERWELSYPATTEIRRRGTDPAAALVEVPALPALRDPAPALRIVQ